MNARKLNTVESLAVFARGYQKGDSEPARDHIRIVDS
jgi:hypothetical protein